MIRRRLLLLLIAPAALAAVAVAPPQLHDWWVYTQFLASDALQGREAGSRGYQMAAQYVADQFKHAGLKPLGTAGSYFQSVSLHSVTLIKEKSSVELIRNGSATAIPLLEQISLTAREDLPEKLEAPMVFAGYALENASGAQVWKGKFVLYLNAVPASQSPSAGTNRTAALAASGALGAVAIDNPRALEVRTWPFRMTRA